MDMSVKECTKQATWRRIRVLLRELAVHVREVGSPGISAQLLAAAWIYFLLERPPSVPVSAHACGLWTNTFLRIFAVFDFFFTI
jgi:hypothetical protein